MTHYRFLVSARGGAIDLATRWVARMGRWRPLCWRSRRTPRIQRPMPAKAMHLQCLAIAIEHSFTWQTVRPARYGVRGPRPCRCTPTPGHPRVTGTAAGIMWCRRHIGKGRTATTTSTRTLGPALNHGTTARTGLTRINRIGQMPINIIGRVTISRTGHDHIRRIGHVRMGLLGEVTHGVLQAVHGNAISGPS